MSVNMIIVIIAFLVLLFLGVPILFAIGIPGIVWLFLNPSMPVTIVSQNMMNYLLSFTLICLPGFMFVGRMMNSAGITDRLFNFSVAVVGRFRGGLAHANSFASMLFASMSGSAMADAGGLGLVEMNMMKKAGYKGEFAAGVTAASSILGPIIPPSAAMVMLGTMAEVSVAAMFFGGIIPGIMLCGALMIQVALRAKFTKEGRNWPTTKISIKETLKTIPKVVPALMTFVIILGSILAGICTPTEAAVLAVWYSIFLGICYKKVNLKVIWETLKETVKACGPLLIIMTAASFFTWTLMIEGLPQFIQSGMSIVSSYSDFVLILICVLIFFVIGCFLDTSAAVLLLTPIVMPVVKTIGINPIYFGVLMIIALMIGIITPPFGICLFVVSGVAKLPVSAVTKEAVRYIPGMIVVLLLIMLFPQVVMWLPDVLLK